MINHRKRSTQRSTQRNGARDGARNGARKGARNGARNRVRNGYATGTASIFVAAVADLERAAIKPVPPCSTRFGAEKPTPDSTAKLAQDHPMFCAKRTPFFSKKLAKLAPKLGSLLVPSFGTTFAYLELPVPKLGTKSGPSFGTQNWPKVLPKSRSKVGQLWARGGAVFGALPSPVSPPLSWGLRHASPPVTPRADERTSERASGGTDGCLGQGIRLCPPERTSGRASTRTHARARAITQRPGGGKTFAKFAGPMPTAPAITSACAQARAPMRAPARATARARAQPRAFPPNSRGRPG